MAAALIADPLLTINAAVLANRTPYIRGLVARAGTGRAVATLCPPDQGPGWSILHPSRLQLLLRRFDDTAFVPVPGTDDARVPFWSPDGRSIAFFAGGKLRRMAATGGSVVTICDVEERSFGGSWGRNGDILLEMRGVIYRVAASGGIPVAVTSLDSARGDKEHRSPHFQRRNPRSMPGIAFDHRVVGI